MKMRKNGKQLRSLLDCDQPALGIHTLLLNEM